MEPVNAPVRVLLVDDDALVRAGLRLMLSGGGDIEVVGEADDGSQVAAAVAEHRPDVVLMDVRMPGVDGIAATEQLRTGLSDGTPRFPGPQVLVLTTFDADATVVRALRAGAAGYLLKHTDPARIVEAVRRAALGEPVLSPSVARALMDRVAGIDQVERSEAPTRRDRARARLALLTERERDVAEAVTEGLSNAEIADRLFMSMGTVKAHVSSALTKLDLSGRIQLALLTHDARDLEG
ncbi:MULTISPECIES: response regulator transcription factor [Nocardiopsis]|uniref:response regulator transcription factor n=1 Tax=Nocardiopsis TaxID=2013 RepID=UPI000346CDE9|nr:MULTISPECIES: response regulator transcription factor [Nocardiopsis]PWV57341.1 LuxR family two component transcriptional regulator [Nocardiopsis sp. L17-MgMaSL7]